MLRTVFEASSAQETLAHDLHRMLRHLAERPEARALDAVSLEKDLTRLLQEKPFLSNIAVANVTGAIIASAKKPYAGINIGKQAYFRTAVDRDAFAIDDYGHGEVTGNPVMRYALPITGAEGKIVGVAVAAIHLQYFPKIFAQLSVPAGAFLALLDDRGTILTCVPGRRDLAPGTDVAGTLGKYFSWARTDGLFETRGPSGANTLYAYRLLRPGSEAPKPYGAILVGMPEKVVMEDARSRLFLSVVVSVGSLLAAIALLVVLSRVLIVRRLEVLTGFAASLAEEKVCRLPPHFGRDEIGLLGRRLADMSEALHDKSERLADTMTRLSRQRDHLAAVVGQLSETQGKLERLASLDDLTGLRNRRCFNEKLDEEIGRTTRYGVPFSLIMFDIDDFKKVNDTYGHHIGDDVLRALGEITLCEVRTVDRAYRVGGEEFTILLPGTTGENAIVLAERLRCRVATLPIALPGDGILHFTISLGVAQAWPGILDEKDIFAAADDALYAAKRTGKNRSVLWNGQNLA